MRKKEPNVGIDSAILFNIKESKSITFIRSGKI
jgi:hypothetical protein